MGVIMNTDKRDYALGTYIIHQMPWSIYVSGAALCPDGKVRRLKRIASTADTFFSIPASVTYLRKTVSGFVTVKTLDGFDTPTEEDPAVVKFIPYTYGKNGKLFATVKGEQS
jgi:hypothetical protein